MGEHIFLLFLDDNERLHQGETRGVNIGRGVRQGFCLSLILFKLCGACLTK